MILLLIGATDRAVGVVREAARAYSLQVRTGTSQDRPDWVITASAAERTEAIRRYGLPSYRVVDVHDVGSGEEPSREVVRTALGRMKDIGPLPPRRSRLVTAFTKPAIPLLAEWGTWLAVDEARQRIAAHASFVESKLGAAARARVLFVVPDVAAFMALVGLLKGLSREGHQAHVTITNATPADAEMLSGLQNLRGVTVGRAPQVGSPWKPLATLLRSRLQRPVRTFTRPVMEWIEHGLPPELDIITFLEDRKPDVVVVVPHRSTFSPETDYFRVARRLGIPSLCLPLRWDDLQSGATVRFDTPDAIAVWSEDEGRAMADERRVPSNRLHVTGVLLASDATGDRQLVADGGRSEADTPEREGGSRARYCAKMGVDPLRRIILFEAPAVSTPASIDVFRRWRQAIKEDADPEVRMAAVVVYVCNADDVSIWRRLALAAEIAVARAGDAERAPFRLNESLMAADIVIATDVPFLLEAGVRAKPTGVLLHDPDADSDIARFCRARARNGWPTVARTAQEAVSQISASLAAVRTLSSNPAAGVVLANDTETAAVRVQRLLNALSARRLSNEVPSRPSTWKRAVILCAALLATRRARQ